MKHPWIRLPDFANALGLIFGAIGIIFIGLQLNKKIIIIFGAFSLLFFIIFFILVCYLMIRDYRTLYPIFKRGFWIFKY